MFIDSHAHLGDAVFGDVREVLERAREVGIETVVNICTDEKTLERGLRLEGVVCAAATTPHEAEDELFFPLVEKAAYEGRLVAIGETGLDYYYEHAPKEAQRKSLLRHFDLAKKVGLPVAFHCREAFDDLFALDREAYGGRALVHCFTGTLEEAKRALDRGWFLSFSGIITFKKSEALRQVVSFVPLERMMIETDSPYLAPQSKRGSRNEPSFLVETAEMIGALKGVSLEEVGYTTTKNARVFFSL